MIRVGALALAGGLLATTVAGCSGGSTSVVAPAPAALATVSPTVSPTPGPAPTRVKGLPPTPTATRSAVPAKGSKDFGYFTQVMSSGSEPVLRFDRAQFLTGEAANKAAGAHGQQTPVPNDYYVVNDNTLLRDLTLAADVVVLGSAGLNGYAGGDGVEAQKRTVQDLLAYVDTEDGRNTGFNLVYGESGRVVRVEEQFVP